MTSNPKSRKPPPHWPADVVFIDRHRFHSSVPKELVSLIRGSVPRTPANARNLAVIRTITSPSHPAYRQRGLFAFKKIPPRTCIVEYIGEIHCDDRPNSDYDLSLHRTQAGINIGIDASGMGNEGRFVNDFRSIRAKPNAEFTESPVSDEGLRMEIWSGAEVIQKGDEILVSYGKSWWRDRCAVKPDLAMK